MRLTTQNPPVEEPNAANGPRHNREAGLDIGRHVDGEEGFVALPAHGVDALA